MITPIYLFTKWNNFYRMNMMKCMILLFTTILVGCGGNLSKQRDDNLLVLTIDWNGVVDKFDYSSMVEDSVLMIPLETREDCLIGEVTKLIYQNDLIYVADEISKSIFVFDLSGKFVTKVHSPGNGPGEYVNITGFVVYGDDIIIYDHMMGRLFFYDANGQFIRDKDVSAIWGTDMFEMDNKLYLVNDGSTSESGCYHLFTVDLPDADKYGMYLPFDKEKDNQGWGVDSYCSKLKDEALIFFWPYDTLYSVKAQEAYPSYRIDFGNKRLPKETIYGDGVKALQTAISGSYVTGLNRVHQSNSFLFLLYGDSDSDYTTVYNKKTGSMQTSKSLVNDRLGGLLLQSSKVGYTIQDERIIQCYPADYIGYFSEEYLDEAHFYSEDLRQRFKEWFHCENEEMNPVVFIQKLKQ